MLIYNPYRTPRRAPTTLHEVSDHFSPVTEVWRAGTLAQVRFPGHPARAPYVAVHTNTRLLECSTRRGYCTLPTSLQLSVCGHDDAVLRCLLELLALLGGRDDTDPEVAPTCRLLLPACALPRMQPARPAWYDIHNGLRPAQCDLPEPSKKGWQHHGFPGLLILAKPSCCLPCRPLRGPCCVRSPGRMLLHRQRRPKGGWLRFAPRPHVHSAATAAAVALACRSTQRRRTWTRMQCPR